MTPQERKVMELALEALENHSGNYKLSKVECVKHEAVVEAIKEALAEIEKQGKIQTVDSSTERKAD